MPIAIAGSGTITGVTAGGLEAGAGPVLDTAKSATGTFVDFASIPSWVKRITVMFQGVSTNGTTSIQVQLGAGSIQTTGYKSSANNASYSTTGLLATSNAAAANDYQGSMIITLLGSNAWVAQAITARNDASTFWCAGSVTLSGTLDRIRITTVNGTDTFDAGTINIMYE